MRSSSKVEPVGAGKAPGGQIATFGSSEDAGAGSKWGRIRQARAVTVTAQELNREAQEIGSAQVLTLNQLENAANNGQTVHTSRFVILPTNQLKKAWDLVVVFILAFSAIVVPFRVAFLTTEDLLDPWSITEVIMDFFLLADVVLTFFSAVETDTIVIVDHRTIAWRYLTGWFCIELLASVPIALFLPSVGQNLRGVRLLRIPRLLKLLKILRLLRVARVLRASKYARTIQRFVNLNPAILRLMIFVMAFLLFAHITASFWFLVAELEDFHPDTWVVRYGILDSDRIDQYIASFYFATTLLSTTGLGDVVPLAQSELLFTIFLELAGVTIISYMTSTITGLIGSFDARARRRQDKFEEIERFMGAKALSPVLRGTIRDYFELVLATKSTAALDEAKLLAELSGPLQTAVMFEVHSSLIDRFSFFKGKQPEFVRDVLMSANPMVVKHDRVLMREGMTGDSLLLLISGRVNFESSQGTVYMQLPPGSVFGAMSLLCTGRNVCNARSVGDVQTYTLARRDVERILEDYPDVENELLALALARLRRLQVERRKTRSQRLAAGVAVFSPEAEAATDAAVTRGLATKPGAGVADSTTIVSRRIGADAGRRASAPTLTVEDLASGRAAGSAERIALLRHMADTKQFRRLSSSGSHARRGEPASQSRTDGDGVSSPSWQESRGKSGAVYGRADSKAAAAGTSRGGGGVEREKSPSASVLTAMQQAEAEHAANSDSATSQSMRLLTSPRRTGSDVTDQPVDAAGRSRGTHTSGFMKAAGLGPPGLADAGAPVAGAALAPSPNDTGLEDGKLEGGPEGTAPRLLDAESRQESLTGKSRSGVALRDSASASKHRGSRRHSLASADPFDRRLTQNKEQELREQTDSLIERTLTTAKRAVRRKERLVTRMAAERERRQFTSRPVHGGGRASSPYPENKPLQMAEVASAPAPPLMTASLSQSKTLKKRARGLRAKLGKQRQALRAMAAIGMSPAASQGGEPSQDAGAALTPPAAVPAVMQVGAAKPPGSPQAAALSLSAATVAGSSSSSHNVTAQPGEAPQSSGRDLDGLRLVTTSSNLLLSPDPRSSRAKGAIDPSTAFALDEMTVAMRGVASALMGLQQEQEAIVDLLIAVLADDDAEDDAP